MDLGAEDVATRVGTPVPLTVEGVHRGQTDGYLQPAGTGGTCCTDSLALEHLTGGVDTDDHVLAGRHMLQGPVHLQFIWLVFFLFM